MARVVTFGEIMLRLSPLGYHRFFQNDQMEATFGGSEANVAVSLANFGIDTAFVTRLPGHQIGKAAASTLRGFGVNISHISYGGERLGVYYMEKGASQRGSLCIYDRKNSSFQTAELNDFCWEKILEGAQWFHFSGITPALSANLAGICLEACQTAKRKGIRISCDLNYRSKLWSPEQAESVMRPLCQYVDVCIANEEDFANVFGIQADNTDVSAGILDTKAYLMVAQKAMQRFPFSCVAITMRTSYNANQNRWAAMLYDGSAVYNSKAYELQIVDRVGAGDSFCGGLIYAMLQGMCQQDIIEFATATSALKHSVEGDFNRVSTDEVFRLMNGDTSGRVKR